MISTQSANAINFHFITLVKSLCQSFHNAFNSSVTSPNAPDNGINCSTTMDSFSNRSYCFRHVFPREVTSAIDSIAHKALVQSFVCFQNFFAAALADLAKCFAL